jgi:hypothetical protein
MAGRRRALALTVLAGVGLGLSACGSDYRYVNNAEERTFFRVPAGMEVFRIRSEQPTDRIAPVTSMGANEPWNVVFDADAAPSPDHVTDIAPAAIVGRAEIIPIGSDTSDAVSVKQARAALAGGDDPLDATDGSTEIVSFSTLNKPGGLTGSRVVFSREVRDGVWTTYDQSSLIDVAGRKVYFFEVKCEAACFKAQRDQISQIVNSWQVRT